MALLVQAPEGFHQAIQTANTLPSTFVEKLCHDVILFLSGKIGLCSTSRYAKEMESLSPQVQEICLRNLINAITYTYRYAIKENLDSSTLKQSLMQSIICNEATSAAVSNAWTEENRAMVNHKESNYLHIGKLVDMQWKLSFATCSSRCPNMNTPLVTIKLTIALPNGSTTDKCFELEIAEFKDFSVRIKEIASMIENV